jgi:hypothetical protein
MDDSRPAGLGGDGKADPRILKNLADVWGKLPERERAKAMMELTRNMPPQYREVVERYFKELSRSEK